MLFTVAPAISLVTLWLQFNFLTTETFHTALAMVILVLSIPFHSYFILGQKAEEKLPLGLISWYREIEQKVQEHKQDLSLSQQTQLSEKSAKSDSKLNYMDLANLLNVLFKKR